MATDVVGYSRMMNADEAGTLKALKRHRESLVDPTVAAHNGRLVKLLGDGSLVEFSSVVDAVGCAVSLQRALHSGCSINDGIVLRIGINIGDVIIDGDDIYGEGVNIAARLEPLAEPGGVCVSSIVVDSLGRKTDIVFVDCGKVAVKNIDQPIGVWKWHPSGEGPGNTGPQAVAQPLQSTDQQSSVAVLAFNNLSGDPEQEYFSDGISEDIITDLSKISGLFVISRNSSFSYKGKSPDIRTVGRELGVGSVLEGSVRRAGDRVRITAQLIDAATGAHLWADRYDRELTDIFAVQDDVTTSIVSALRVTLTTTEQSRITQVLTHNAEAHDLFLRGREALLSTQNNKEMFELAVRCFNRSIALDPDYAEPYVGLAHAYNRDFQNKWTGRPDSKELAAQFSELALAKAPDLAYAHYMAGLTKFWNADLAGATASMERALQLSPNFALAIGMRGLANIYGGSPLDAVPDLERAFRLDPLAGHLYLHFKGTAYLLAGETEKAVEAFEERIGRSPNTDLTRGLLISALGHLGDRDRARRIQAELTELNPAYSFAEHIGRLPFSDPADAKRLLDGYAKAEVAN